MINICLFIERLRVGGKERQLLNLFESLRDTREFEVSLVLLYDIIEYENIDLKSVKVILAKGKNSIENSFQLFATYCREIRPDIIHTWGFKSTQIAIPASLFLGIRLVNGSIRYARKVPAFTDSWWYGILTFPFSHRVIANSKAGLISHGLKPSKKNKFVYNGFNNNKIWNEGGMLRTELGLKNEFVIGMVANFYTAKDQVSLIKAGIELLDEGRNIKIIFIGEGPKRVETERIVPEKFKDQIVFLGRRQDVNKLLTDIDLGVLISLQNHAEGISNSIMEYMAHAKPVIATRVGGNPELVENEVTGFLIPHEDVSALKNKISFLMDNPEIAKQMGDIGRKRLLEKFSMETMVNQYIDLYKELVN